MNRRIMIATALMIVGLSVLPAAGSARTPLASEQNRTVTVKVVGTGVITAHKDSAGKTCSHVGTTPGTCTFIFAQSDRSYFCPDPDDRRWCYEVAKFSAPRSRTTRVVWDLDYCLVQPEGTLTTCLITLRNPWAVLYKQPGPATIGPMKVAFVPLSSPLPVRLSRLMPISIRGRGSVVSADGSVVCAPARSGDVTNCSKRLTVGRVLRLRAIPQSGWKLSVWQGCPAVVRTTCTVTVARTNTAVVAVFVRA